MRRGMCAIALAGVAVAGPQALEGQTTYSNIWAAEVCNGSTLRTCTGFDVTAVYEGGVLSHYLFTVEYLSSLNADPGVITAAGLYDLAGTPDFVFSNIELVESPDGKTWVALAGDNPDCEHLSGGGRTLFEACSDASPPPTANGLALGERIVFRFNSSAEILAAHFSVDGGLGARAHIQSFGDADCSFKPDSRQGIVSGPDGGIDTCTSVVPEPVTMLLLGSGLAGVGGVAMRRRRNGLALENA